MSSNKLFLKAENEAIEELYVSHQTAFEGDLGLDLFFPESLVIPARSTKLIDFKVSTEMRQINRVFDFGSDNTLYTNVGYFLVPRSSIYKTPLRQCNSFGVIDAKYRNTLKVAVDNISDNDYQVTKGDRLFQIVLLKSESFNIVIADRLSDSTRGSGFGSSGK